MWKIIGIWDERENCDKSVTMNQETSANIQKWMNDIHFRWLETWSWSKDYRACWERNAYAKRSKCHYHYGIIHLYIYIYIYIYILSKFIISLLNVTPLWSILFLELKFLCIEFAAWNWNWYCSFPIILVENVLWEARWLQGKTKATISCSLRMWGFRQLADNRHTINLVKNRNGL